MDTTTMVQVWRYRDPVLDGDRRAIKTYDPWSVRFHLPSLGPTSSWILTLLADRALAAGPLCPVIEYPAVDLAKELGIGQARLHQSLHRLCSHRAMTYLPHVGHHAYRVHLLMPGLNLHQVGQLPAHVRKAYDRHLRVRR